MAARRLKGPRLDGGVLAHLDMMAGFLHDQGLTEAEARVREAAALAGTDPDKAADILAEAIALVRARAPEARQSD